MWLPYEAKRSRQSVTIKLVATLESQMDAWSPRKRNSTYERVCHPTGNASRTDGRNSCNAFAI